MAKKRYLVLENGRVFEGVAFGADKETAAEVVFTTGAAGFAALLSDPRYSGQAVVQTYPLVGDIRDLQENDAVYAAAYIVRECWDAQACGENPLDTLLKKYNIPGLCGIDTRALTKILREEGVMNGVICDDPARAGAVESAAVCTPAVAEATYYETEQATRTVALLDFGMSAKALRMLQNSGCNVWLLPYTVSAAALADKKVDGVVLSDGPGDPRALLAAAPAVSALGDLPTYGIGLGHQLLALAAGFAVSKLKYGHRGGNQPVRDLESRRIYTTSQNHGFAVDTDSIAADVAKPLYANENDGTCEGVAYLTRPAFSTQFHPDDCGGPQDTMFLFDRFFALMK